MPFYRKRPVVIDANEWDGTEDSYQKIVNWSVSHGVFIERHFTLSATDEVELNVLHIPTLEGTMTAQPGDFIIRGVQGEFYPCKPEIFWKTYEEL